MAGAAIGTTDIELSVIVCRGGFAPQIQVSSLRLDLTPDGQSAKHEQGKNNQLLHCARPSSLDYESSGSAYRRSADGTARQPVPATSGGGFRR
jgi:hypothetical protein